MGAIIEALHELPDGLASADQVVRRASAAGLMPDPEWTVSQWADQHRMLSQVTSSEHGQWRTSRVPYLREIMDCLSPSHPCTEVTFQKGTQIGGSEAGYNWVGSIIHLWPASVMVVMPTTDTAKRISRTRIAQMIADTQVLAARVADAKARDSANTVLMKEFPGGVLIITGANSGPGLRSMPVRFLFLDEVDAYPVDVGGEGDPCLVAEKRTDTYKLNRKIFRCSSPKLSATSRIARYYEQSDQRRYHVPCPCCGHEQWLRWEQMRWDTRHVWEITSGDSGELMEVPADTPGAVERDTGELTDVWYECESCQQRIDEHHKTAMLDAGRWMAMRPGAGRHPGFHLSALYSPIGWFGWWDAVKQHLESEQDLTGELRQVFVNTVLGEPYEPKGTGIADTALKAHIGDYRVGGPVPRQALMLTAGVDVQHDRLEARVWGWGRGEESWLVAREILWGSPTDEATWTALEELIFRGWPHEGGATLRIVATAIDAGDGNTTHQVREFARRWAHRDVLACKGQAVAGKPILGRPTLQDVSHRGKVLKDAVKLWPVGSDTAKSLIYRRYELEQPGPQYVHLPQGLPDDEFSQMTAERQVTKYVRGFPRQSWVKKPTDRNEALDCYVLALVAALYAGVTRMDWDRMEQLLIQPDMFVRREPPTDPPAAQAANEAEEARPDASEPGDPAPAAPEATTPPPTRREGWLQRRDNWVR